MLTSRFQPLDLFSDYEEESRCVGYVYVVRMGTDSIFKIGRSNDVPRRMSDFGVQLPFPFHLVFALRHDNYIWAEKRLHETFKHRRLNGEWFQLEPCDLVYIQYWLLTHQTWTLWRSVLSHMSIEGEAETIWRVMRIATRVLRRLERRQWYVLNSLPQHPLELDSTSVM